MNPIVSYIGQFLLLVLLQVLVVDHLYLGAISAFIAPSVYFLFVLSLPHKTSQGMLMLLAFAIGMAVDIFKSTPGMHASAMVVLAYVRPYFLKILEPRDGYDETKKPSVYSMKRNVYFAYAGLTALVFHLWYFTIEVMRFSDYHIVLAKTILSSVMAVILIMLIQYLTVKKS